MGVLNYAEPHHRLSAPDTPPELVSPTSSSYSSRISPSVEQPWKPAAPISPPMSNYDRSSVSTMSSTGKRSEDGQVHKDVSNPGSRTQLPSLSSLFPQHTTRPLHSPALSDHHGSYLAASPLEPSSRVNSSHSDRPPFPSPFFGSSSIHHTAQTRSTYDPRYDSDRHSPLHPLHRPLSRPNSPNYRLRNDHRRHDGVAGSRWPKAIHEPAQPEYALRDRDVPSLSSAHVRLPPTHPAPRNIASGFRAESASSHLLAPSSISHPGTPALTEGLPSKDGLGPKIWTGTHFLPRFVCTAEVPGEGMCYFYDDGSHCKTVIDGEPVNAHWGVTKAGKPRKRLAIACVTCREKKIKCDPDYPQCVQCEKFGRVCKFKNAPRGGHNTSPSTPESEDVRRLASPSHFGETSRMARHSSASLSPRTVYHPAMPEETGSYKRIRVGYEGYSPAPCEPNQFPPPSDVHKPSMGWQRRPLELPRIRDDMLNRTWRPQS